MSSSDMRLTAATDLGAPVTTVRLEDIVVDDPRFQVRETLDEATVEHYRTILDQLPPIRVARIDGRLVLIDGRHRVEAALREGRRELPAVIKDLDEREALREAIRANAKNGLPLTLAERKRAAVRLLKLFPEASDRSIAHDVGLSDKTVGQLRRQLESSAGIPHLTARVGRDRKVRTVRKTSSVSRLRRPRMPPAEAEPAASGAAPTAQAAGAPEPEASVVPEAPRPEADLATPEQAGRDTLDQPTLAPAAAPAQQANAEPQGKLAAERLPAPIGHDAVTSANLAPRSEFQTSTAAAVPALGWAYRRACQPRQFPEPGSLDPSGYDRACSFEVALNVLRQVRDRDGEAVLRPWQWWKEHHGNPYAGKQAAEILKGLALYIERNLVPSVPAGRQKSGG